MNDLPELKLGKIGEQVQAVGLAYYKDRAMAVLAPDDEIAMTAITVDMAESVSSSFRLFFSTINLFTTFCIIIIVIYLFNKLLFRLRSTLKKKRNLIFLDQMTKLTNFALRNMRASFTVLCVLTPAQHQQKLDFSLSIMAIPKKSSIPIFDVLHQILVNLVL